MNIKVEPYTIEIEKLNQVNSGEYNIAEMHFEFSNEYEGLTKQAVFSTCDETYKTPILNDTCIIPYEVLQEPGNVLLGVFGYESVDNELQLRYSPTPKYFNVAQGSYKEGSEPSLPPRSEWEQLVEEVNEAITETNNLNIEAEKEDGTTTITITHKDGTEQEVQILDGEKGDKGDKGDPGSVHMIVVQTLPTENIDDSAIYLVPLEQPTEEGNNYAEYVYINGQWELLGKIGVHVDLTDYVKNTDYAQDNKGGVIKTSTNYGFDMFSNGFIYAPIKTYAQYQALTSELNIGKGTLENVITGKDLTTKAYVDGLVGNIQTLLDTLNNGNGVS